jgi:hypothetical protein
MEKDLAKELAFIDFTFTDILSQLCDVVVDGDQATK